MKIQSTLATKKSTKRWWHAACFVGLGVCVGRLSSAGADQVVEERVCPAEVEAREADRGRAEPRTIVPGAASKPAARAATSETVDTAAERAQRMQKRSTDLMGNIRDRIRNMHTVTPGQQPAHMAMRLNDYLHAWKEALGSSPEFVDALSDQVREAVCQPQAGEEGTTSMMVYARMMRIMPDLASDEAFDCFFDSVKQEDPVLWEGISAWKISGYPKPAALQALEENASKPMTKQLIDPDQQVAQEMEPKGPELDARGFPLPGQLVAPPGGKLGLPPSMR